MSMLCKAFRAVLRRFNRLAVQFTTYTIKARYRAIIEGIADTLKHRPIQATANYSKCFSHEKPGSSPGGLSSCLLPGNVSFCPFCKNLSFCDFSTTYVKCLIYVTPLITFLIYSIYRESYRERLTYETQLPFCHFLRVLRKSHLDEVQLGF